MSNVTINLNDPKVQQLFNLIQKFSIIDSLDGYVETHNNLIHGFVTGNLIEEPQFITDTIYNANEVHNFVIKLLLAFKAFKESSGLDYSDFTK